VKPLAEAYPFWAPGTGFYPSRELRQPALQVFGRDPIRLPMGRASIHAMPATSRTFVRKDETTGDWLRHLPFIHYGKPTFHYDGIISAASSGTIAFEQRP
jgi:hypothetical protein